MAAEQDNARAQVNCGLMYEHGAGIPQSYIKALAWYKVSSASSEIAVGNIIPIEMLLSPEQLLEAEQLSNDLVKGFKR